VLIYRVFPFRADAGPGEPGHPLYVHPEQGYGRWDNADLYSALYVASSGSAAIGETFAHLSIWSAAMLPFPAIEDSRRVLGIYAVDEETHPLLNLDDSAALLQRGLRPTDVVIRNRPRTQAIARDVFGEALWSGLSWWSMHRPQWVLHVYWNLKAIELAEIQTLPSHPAMHDAARLLAKQVNADIM
jgi:hypothetical protein